MLNRMRKLGLHIGELAMVGDDLHADIAGSRAVGLTGILVQTGKSRAGEIESSGIRPDLLVASLAELPEQLG